MLPGNINNRIVTLANKHEGFEGHLFLNSGFSASAFCPKGKLRSALEGKE
jgi:hypothetical protein